MDTTFTGHHLPSRYADSRTLPSGRALKQRLVDVPHEPWMSALALLIAGHNVCDGSAASLVYDDVLRRTEAGWRISCRRITLRRKPLQP
jgi:phosphohistidine phosphatase SixA